MHSNDSFNVILRVFAERQNGSGIKTMKNLDLVRIILRESF